MILGITGSFGAGKGAVVDYLTSKKGFLHFSAREFITEEIQKRGMPVNRDSMIFVANDLRATHSPTFIIESLFSEAQKQVQDAVIESIREVAGARFIKERGGIVFGVTADPEIRYERIVKRGNETDNVSFETWLEQERKESNQNDPTKQDIFGALTESDYLLNNNGSLDELHTQIEEVLLKINQNQKQ